MAVTKTQKIISWMQRECKELPSRSRKRKIFEVPESHPGYYARGDKYYVGNAGSLRVGKNFADSVPLPNLVARIVASYDKEHAKA